MKRTYILFFIILFIVSCRSEKEKLTENIKKNEKELSNDSTQVVNRKKAEEMINLYKEYAERYKEDTTSAEYLFRAGDISNGIGDYKKAIELYAKCTEYNNYSKQPIALFLQGFIYETQLGDMVNAKRIYELFLQKYPDNKLANDVRFSLDNLGKSPEDLIKMFEQRDSIAAAKS
jgi:tetratricopeptide (TPR) repeat protein